MYECVHAHICVEHLATRYWFTKDIFHKKQPWFLEEVANSACGQEMYKMNLKVHLGQKAEKEQKKVA